MPPFRLSLAKLLSSGSVGPGKLPRLSSPPVTAWTENRIYDPVTGWNGAVWIQAWGTGSHHLVPVGRCIAWASD